LRSARGGQGHAIKRGIGSEVGCCAKTANFIKGFAMTKMKKQSPRASGGVLLPGAVISTLKSCHLKKRDAGLNAMGDPKQGDEV